MSKGARRSLFRHGELHLVVLAVLERQPMHGYQLMGELNRLFAPGYRASPGSVYPCVESLAEAGLVTGTEEGGRRVYALTPSGAVALSRRVDELAAVETRTGVRLGAGGVDGSLDRFVARVRAVAPRIESEALDEALTTAAANIEHLADQAPAHTSTTTRRIS